MDEGAVAGGSKVEIPFSDPQRVSVIDIVDLYLGRNRDPELLQHHGSSDYKIYAVDGKACWTLTLAEGSPGSESLSSGYFRRL